MQQQDVNQCWKQTRFKGDIHRVTFSNRLHRFFRSKASPLPGDGGSHGAFTVSVRSLDLNLALTASSDLLSLGTDWFYTSKIGAICYWIQPTASGTLQQTQLKRCQLSMLEPIRYIMFWDSWWLYNGSLWFSVSQLVSESQLDDYKPNAFICPLGSIRASWGVYQKTTTF